MEKNQVLTLGKNESYVSSSADEAVFVSAGSVYVYIAPWDEQLGRVNGQKVLLMTMEDETRCPIPALVYHDGQRHWRLVIVAGGDGVSLQMRPNNATLALKKNFLRLAGIDTFEQEGGSDGGFENSLLSFYRRRMAQDANTIYGSEKVQPEVRQSIFDNLQHGVNDRQSIDEFGSDMIYRTVKYAARKCRIADVAKEDQVRSALADTPMTVPDIARVSHFICRSVVLDDEWYKSDCGVLIGAMFKEVPQPDAKTLPETEPVVYYRRGEHYWVHNMATGKDEKLTLALLARMNRTVYLIRRSLPKRSLSGKDVRRFVAHSVQGREMAWLLALSLITTLIGVLTPKLNQLIYDEYIPMGDVNLLMQICLVIAAFMVGNVFISVAKSLMEFIVPARAGYELQDATYFRLFELQESFFRDYDSGDLAQRVAGVGSIANGILSKLVSNGFALVMAIVYLVQMASYSGILAAAGVVMLAVYGVIVYLLSISTLKSSREAARQQGVAQGKLYQYLNGIEKIRMAGAEDRAILEYTTPVAREKQIGIRMNRRAALAAVLMDAGSTIFSMVLYFLMVRTKTNLTAGSFMAFSTAFGAFSGAVMGFVQAAADYASMKPGLERVKPLFDAAPENDTDKEMITGLTGEIRVDQVTFAYNDSQKPVLNNLSIHIRPGEYVAIVGPSGCGKSTLLKLLLGFETPQHGHISYDNKDIRSLDKHALRKQLGVVLQNGRLITGSIYDNITITSARPDPEKVWRVIDDVGLTEDVKRMPMQLQTLLSEGGGTISGGQQQRILIARAIYNDPAVLFFDEATSALDNITQAKVCESLEKRRMTRMVIAHRLSTVRSCDRIIVLDQGHVIEEGNFDALMARRGYFYEMASRQLV